MYVLVSHNGLPMADNRSLNEKYEHLTACPDDGTDPSHFDVEKILASIKKIENTLFNFPLTNSCLCVQRCCPFSK